MQDQGRKESSHGVRSWSAGEYRAALSTFMFGPTEKWHNETKECFLFEKQRKNILEARSKERVVLWIGLEGRVWFVTLMLWSWNHLTPVLSSNWQSGPKGAGKVKGEVRTHFEKQILGGDKKLNVIFSEQKVIELEWKGMGCKPSTFKRLQSLWGKREVQKTVLETTSRREGGKKRERVGFKPMNNWSITALCGL